MSCSKLQVFPPVVEFDQVELDVRYIMTMTIQNISTSVLRYRISPPITKFFTVINAPTRLIAPGLEIQIDVQFEATSLTEDYLDRIIVAAENCSVEIPLRARVPCSNIQLEGFLNLGPVVLNNRAAAFIDLVNKGTREGTFNIEYDDSLPLEITPMSGTIAPSSTHERLKIEFHGTELGIFRAIANVRLNNQPDRVIDINATVVEHRLEFVHPNGGGQIQAIPFGSIYYGQERTITALLVNNGPKPVAYQTMLAITSPVPVDDRSDLAITPSEGVVAPYSETLFTFFYKPIKPKVPKGFSKDKTLPKSNELAATFNIDSSEIDQQISVDISGTAAYPSLELSQRIFDFGECPAGERVDILMTVKNTGILPVEYAINKVAHFSCRPNRGRLESMQSQTTVISFTPAQMGIFESTLHFVVGKGLQTLTISLKGESKRTGVTKKTTRGSKAIPQDFKAQFNFVPKEEIEASKTRKSKFERVPPWKRALSDGTATFDPDVFATGNDTHLTYSVNEIQRREAHRSEYNEFLKESRVRREETSTRRSANNKIASGSITLDPNNAANIGIEPQSGMEGPVPSLPKVVEPLWLKSEARGRDVAKNQHDENRLIKKKFKPNPVTQAERKDCSTQLTTEQLKRVVAGPKLIDFGAVCVNSTTKKSFAVSNDLKQTILVELLITNGHEELQNTSPLSQVIPPGATAGFDVTFFSRVEQDYCQSFNYVINGLHTYKLSLQAEVQPITLNLEKDLVEFSFSSDSMERSTFENVKITNPGNATATFTSNVPRSSAFSVDPTSCTIPEGQSEILTLTFTPTHGVSNQSSIELCVEGGMTHVIHCVGDSPEAKCTIREKRLDFGTIPAGIEKKIKCVLQNTSPHSAVYYVDTSQLSSCISATPMIGRVAGTEHVQLTLTMKESKPLSLSNEILRIKIRGGKDIAVPVLATVVVPDVQIVEETFVFHATTIGVSTDLPLSIKNDGSVPATLLVDLTSHREFSLRTRITTKEREDGVQLLTEMEDIEDCRKWQISLLPEETGEFVLRYSPETVGEVEFNLPISLTGIEKQTCLSRVIYAEGIKPRLILSSTSIDFGERVIPRDTSRKIPYNLELKITNDDDQPLSWAISDAPLREISLRGMFHIAPSAGELVSGDSCGVRITFLPSERKEYEVELPVFLDGQTEHEYVCLSISGRGISPHLSFSEPEVILPIVPLSIKSVTTFRIINTGYDNLEIQYRLPVDTTKVPISLTFPEGQNVGIANPSVAVQVHFMSKKPMSFTAKIEFFDSDGHVFTIPVSGTTDNCLLTNYEFIHWHSKTFGFFNHEHSAVHYMAQQDIKALCRKVDAAQSSAVSATDKKSISRQRSRSSFSSSSHHHVSLDPTGIVDRSFPARIVPTPSAIAHLIAWLNVNILRSPLSTLPDDLINTNGRYVYEMVEIACGKQVPGRIQKSTGTKRHQWQELVTQYTEMLRFLKSYGAMLHSVRPEHLLNTDDYVRAREEMETEASTFRLSAHAASHRRIVFQKEWLDLSVSAWTMVIYQIIKVFVLFRINPKALDTLPGIRTGGKDIKQSTGKGRGHADKASILDTAVSQSSNVFSVAENTLLQWIMIHFNRAAAATLEPRKIRNFSSDLRDGSVICYLIASHVPSILSSGRPLSGFHRKPQDEAQFLENFEMIQQTLQYLGISYGIEFANMGDREMLLFVMHLYQALPQFVPKTIIEFSGSLGNVIKKSIELKNPSKKPIAYQVSIEGSSEFTIQSNSLHLEPMATASFVVESHPRFTRPAEALLTFKSVREGSTSAASMVFGLKSVITSRQSIRTSTIETMIYEAKNFDLEIVNQFPVDSSYQITMIQEGRDQDLKSDSSLLSGATKKKTNPRVLVPTSHAEFVDNHSPFFSKVENITLRSGEDAVIPIQFLPLKGGTYRCHILLINENVGEFMYEVVGTALLPQATDILKFTTELKPQVTKELQLPPRNPLFQKSLGIIFDRLSGGIKAKIRDALKKCDEKNSTVYNIEVNSPYWKANCATFTVRPESDKPSKGSDAAALCTPRDGSSGVPFIFQPKGAGVYPCTVVLRSSYDIRVYELEVTVTAPGVKTSLEFSAPARQAIVQDIPIRNSSETPWNLRATISGSKMFTGPSGINIPPGDTFTYPLCFTPAWITDESAQLVLLNSVSNEKFEYDLEGHGEEPLAESQINIKCQAREVVEEILTVPNINPRETTRYNIESDLPHITGSSTLSVAAGSNQQYILRFTPLLGGSYTGSITFTTASGEYLWYSIDAFVASPEPESTLDIEAQVRSAVAVEISLANPLNDPVVFDIILNGEGLVGDQSFSLKPLQTATYELIYSPLLPGRQSGSIMFSNDQVGEFWYRLSLNANPAPPTVLPSMCCAVGDISSQPILLANPTGEEVNLSCSIDNRRNYTLRDVNILIAPYDQVNVILDYAPSSIKTPEKAIITFSHSRLGDLVYHVEGTGIKPSRMKETVVVASIGSTVSTFFGFRNPFPTEIPLDVYLEGENKDDAFRIVIKKLKSVLPGFANLQIPIAFSPTHITAYQCSIILRSSDDLTWTYPLRGIAEAPLHQKVLSIVCRARETLETELTLPLSGYEEEGRSEFSYSFSTTPEYEKIVNRSLVLTLIDKPQLPGQLAYAVRFDPLRPFSCMIELIVEKSSGGRWVFQLSLESTDPAVDDTIVIESQLNHTSSVSFKLSNQFRERSPFRCEFTTGSSSVFTVFPTVGAFEPYGGEPTSFVVSFTPTEYGKTLSGRLLICTDEMQWTFDVRGTHPEYVAPVSRPRVNTRLPQEISKLLGRKSSLSITKKK